MVASLFKVYGRLSINSSGERVLTVNPKNNVDAGNRLGLKDITEPTYDKLMATITTE